MHFPATKLLLSGVAGLAAVGLSTAAADPPKTTPPAEVKQETTTRSHDMSAARAAFEAGLASKQQNHFQAAVQLFRRTYVLAPKGSALRQRAKDEVEYYVPLLVIRETLLAGKPGAARRYVTAMLAQHGDNPERVQQLNAILAEIGMVSVVRPTAPKLDSGDLMSLVRTELERFKFAKRRYPRDKKELAQILPPDRAPMSYFELEYYTNHGGGYRLALRDRKNGNLVTVEKTGLLR